MSLLKELRTLSGSQEWGFAGFLLLLIAIIIHIYDIRLRLSVSGSPFFNPALIILYLIMALLATLLLKDKTDTGLMYRLRNKLLPYLGISAAAYVIPAINYLADLSSGLFAILDIPIKLIASIIILFAPIWVLYILYVETTRITRIIGSVYALGWIIILLITISPMMTTMLEDQGLPAVKGIMPGLTVSVLVNKIAANWQATKQAAQEARVDIPAAVRAEIAIAQTGIDPRQSRASEASPEGPQMTIRAVKQKYYENEPISVYATITAEPVEVPIDLNINCVATSNPVSGKIFPDDKITIETKETSDIDCIFPKNSLTPGSHKVTFETTFNYETLSYIETFFMTEETLKEMQKKGLDPMGGYSQPEAITSKGPATLKITTPTAPSPAADNKKMVIGITMYNQGNGQIKQVNDLFIYIPKGFALTEDNYDIYSKIDSCAELPEEEAKICDIEAMDVYKVSSEELESPTYRNITYAKELRMYLAIEDAAKLTGDSPIKPASFHASLKYDYQLEQSTQIDVAGQTDITTI